MSKLTKKQRKFVNEYADTGNGTQSALKAYNTEDNNTAKSIASENLTKPAIREELAILGFNTNTAKRVVGEILSEREVEPQHRLKAADLVFKVTGDYAPEKAITLNLDAQLTENEGGLAEILIELFS